MTPREKELAGLIFDNGIVRLKPSRIRLHDFLPQFPLSPLYFNFRPIPQDPLGALTGELLHDLSRALREKLAGAGIEFEWAAGIPRAGTPIAFMLGNALRKIPVAWVTKTDTPTSKWLREQIELEQPKAQALIAQAPGVLVDDVIGAATTKQKWIRPFRELEIQIAALAVFVDREEGGAEIIEEEFGLPTLPLFRLSDLITLYVETKRITEEKRLEVLNYRLIMKEAVKNLTPRVI